MEFAQDDHDPEVRAAAIYAIGTYIGCVGMDQSEPNIFRLVEHASAIAKLNKDACFLVRKEIVYSIQLIIGEKYTICSVSKTTCATGRSIIGLCCKGSQTMA